MISQRLRWRVGLALRGNFCRPGEQLRSSSLRLASPAMASVRVLGGVPAASFFASEFALDQSYFSHTRFAFSS